MRELQTDAVNLFNCAFFCEICEVFFEKLKETQRNSDRFAEIRGFFASFSRNPQFPQQTPWNLTQYSSFLAENVFSAEFFAFSRKSVQLSAKKAENLQFDLQMSASCANLLVNPHVFKENVARSLGKNCEKHIKMNQVQQSQTLVSSVLNKEEDYLSKMMEGVRNFIEFF